MAIAPFVIRWGPNESSDKLRRCARCVVCGRNGATLRHPSWYDEQLGWQPFPAKRMSALVPKRPDLVVRADDRQVPGGDIRNYAFPQVDPS